MPSPFPDLRLSSPDFTPKTVPCVSLIGMAGAGKSTLGRALAERLGWALVDTDRLMEAHWGGSLQALLDRFGLENFLRAEEDVVAKLWLWRTVVATGGSVIYGPSAVRRLRELGPVVYLRVTVGTVCERVRDAQGRGLARRPGQSLEELYAEREPLYREAADLILEMDDCSVDMALERLCPWLENRLQAGLHPAGS
ncbi:shikimate kinase [Desulfonatronum thiosulfatophilum]|uniref:Shikimate kinase n=1 Tax=Desulfonatronum thiosulfatophilum TaxID=617002 RepID=A0A1G6E175_9BACT|nr:homoserine kinase [Desulfonatronum thiosulfatophilum]SDB51153.1 shikimate kinase [Desulfonatronum thiosulfatophilum]